MSRPDDWETDPGGYGPEYPGPPEPDGPALPRERPRPRHWVIGLALLTVFVLGVVGGVLADRYLAVGCPSCPPPAGVGVPLVGTLESSTDGVLAVRTPDGRLVALRTSPATRVVGQEPRPGPVGALPRGTRVTVLGVPDTDGVLTVEAVGVPG